jgi:hypothetical protein
MIRHEVARILRALADRLEVQKPAPEVRTEIQYVYVHNVPTVTSPPQWWQAPNSAPVPWQSPFYYSTTSGAVN